MHSTAYPGIISGYDTGAWGTATNDGINYPLSLTQEAHVFYQQPLDCGRPSVSLKVGYNLRPLTVLEVLNMLLALTCTISGKLTKLE